MGEQQIARLAVPENLLSDSEIDSVVHERMAARHAPSVILRVRHLGAELGLLMAKGALMYRQQEIVREIADIDSQATADSRKSSALLRALALLSALLFAACVGLAIEAWS